MARRPHLRDLVVRRTGAARRARPPRVADRRDGGRARLGARRRRASRVQLELAILLAKEAAKGKRLAGHAVGRGRSQGPEL